MHSLKSAVFSFIEKICQEQQNYATQRTDLAISKITIFPKSLATQFQIDFILGLIHSIAAWITFEM